MKHTTYNGLVLSSLLFLQIGYSSGTIEFNRRTTGVAFTPYVHNNLSEPLNQDLSSYSLEDVKIMMRVIFTRFSKVATFDVGAPLDIGQYEKNVSYYKSYSSVYAAEAAASVNEEMIKLGSKLAPLEVYVGLWLHPDPNRMALELSLVIESIEKAHAISRGTVKGVVLSNNEIHSIPQPAEHALEKLNQLKPFANEHNIKLGSRQNCEGISLDDASATPLNIARVRIVNASDFIICELQANFNITDASKLLHLKTLNPKIELMVQTGTHARLNDVTEVAALSKHWQAADKLAQTNNVTVWMMEAFDNPWRGDSGADLGWWKLTKDSKTNVVDGYVEKVQKITQTNARNDTSKPKDKNGVNSVNVTKTPKNAKSNPSNPKQKNGVVRNYSVDVTILIFAIISIGIVV